MGAVSPYVGMSRFADRVEQISISGIREVFEAAGDDAINLGLGDQPWTGPAGLSDT